MSNCYFHILIESDSELEKKQITTVHKHFQSKKSGGGECTVTQLSRFLLRLSFAKQEAQARVLSTSHHKINDELTVRVRCYESSSEEPSNVLLETHVSSSASQGLLADVYSSLQETRTAGKHRPGSFTRPENVLTLQSQKSFTEENSWPSIKQSQYETFSFRTDPYLIKYLTENKDANSDVRNILALNSGVFSVSEDEELVQINFSGPGRLDEVMFNEWKRKLEGSWKTVESKYICYHEINVVKCQLLMKMSKVINPSVSIYSEGYCPVKVIVGPLEGVEEINVMLESLVLQEKQNNAVQSKLMLESHLHYLIIQDVIEKEIKQGSEHITLSLDKDQSFLLLNGSPEQVQEARVKVQNYLKTVLEHHVALSTYKIKFLKLLSCDDLDNRILHLFDRKVFVMIRDDVKLLSLSYKLLQEAEKRILDVIQEEVIFVDDKHVLASAEWRSFLFTLENRLNHCSLQVKMFKLEEKDGTQLFIVGFNQEVKLALHKISDYLQERSIVETSLELENQDIVDAFQHLLELYNLEIKNVRIEKKSDSSRTLILKGNKMAVIAAEQKIKQMLKTMKWEVHTLHLPGALRFFEGSDNTYLDIISKATGSIIYLKQSHSLCSKSMNTNATGALTPSSQQGPTTLATFILPGGFMVSVCIGDITKQRVDVIVNAANEELKHDGGVAKAIAEAGGATVRNESKDWILSKGKLLPGQVAMTSAGNLPCEKIIHVVGPKWKTGNTEPEQSKQVLINAILLALTKADNENLQSIAIPCVGSGIFEVPMKICAECIACAVGAFVESYAEKHSVKHIVLIDNIWQKVAELIQACKKKWDSIADGSLSVDDIDTHQMKCSMGQNQIEKIIVCGNIEDQKANVLVAPMEKDLSWERSAIGKSLNSKSSGLLRNRITRYINSSATDIVKVPTEDIPGLEFSYIYFIILNEWDTRNFITELTLQKGIQKCLTSCHESRRSSIVFPVIGAGKLFRFPERVVAQALIEEITKFKEQHPLSTLKDIKIVIHSSDNTAPAEFHKAIMRLQECGISKTLPKEKGAFYHSLTSLPDTVSMNVGNVTVQIHCGNIVQEKTEVIVNSVNFSALNTSVGVAGAIFAAVGNTVMEKLKQGQIPQSGVVCTESGNLSCKRIMHVNFGNNLDYIKKMVTSVIKECDNGSFTSVSFPAFGTGQGGMNSSQVATAMFDAIASAVKSNSLTYLATIRIVILERAVYQIFKDMFQNRYGMNAPKNKWSIFPGISSISTSKHASAPVILESPESFNPAVFNIMGGPDSDVEKAKTKLETIFQEHYNEEIITDSKISTLKPRQDEEILALGTKYGVRITIEKGFIARIRMQGVLKDVLQVVKEVHVILHTKQQKDQEERMTSTVVQWYYAEQGQYIQFKPEVNHEIETKYEVYQTKKDHQLVHMTSSEGQPLLLDFDKKEAMIFGTKQKLKLKRTDKKKGEFPPQWDDMNGVSLMVQQLDPYSTEYNEVASEFTKTAKERILKIERVQNSTLYQAYMVKREQIIEKNGSHDLMEMRLFHGTTKEACSGINLHGFNRSFSGQNGVCYGNGVYFAANASYSAQPKYSKSDTSGQRYMYLARVLAGRYTEGKQGMKMPPARSESNPNDRYDSLVDKIYQPVMYIIFHDDQAYPEYLITFQ
ncbi:protein mono-ADP-ribosyltransferase PARP14-like [Protopterus annectens]|uniref:protein mono-ADP-ribosyltransferase PARP14-like n=1 Tax=Protopterus annectens TaxID=7888 RepID=UPI001CFB0721|nr:protein mono-ADP-ribosyltransferase PARP14-like [Protopterus annectens]